MDEGFRSWLCEVVNVYRRMTWREWAGGLWNGLRLAVVTWCGLLSLVILPRFYWPDFPGWCQILGLTVTVVMTLLANIAMIADESAPKS